MTINRKCLSCGEGGTNAYYKWNTGSNNQFETDDIYTFEWYFKLNSQGSNEHYMNVLQEAGSYKTYFRFRNNSSSQVIYEQVEADFTSHGNYESVTYATDEWIHQVYRYDSDNDEYVIYEGDPSSDTFPGDYTERQRESRTGATAGYAAWSDNSTRTSICIGADKNEDNGIDGYLADMRLWSIERDDADINADKYYFLSETKPTGGLNYFKLNELSPATDPEDHWGSVTAITYTEGATGEVGFDDSPFPEPAPPSSFTPKTMPFYILNNQQSFM